MKSKTELLLIQYTKDETHINPAHIEFIVSNHETVDIHFVSGSVMTLEPEAFVDMLKQMNGEDRGL